MTVICAVLGIAGVRRTTSDGHALAADITAPTTRPSLQQVRAVTNSRATYG